MPQSMVIYMSTYAYAVQVGSLPAKQISPQAFGVLKFKMALPNIITL